MLGSEDGGARRLRVMSYNVECTGHRHAVTLDAIAAGDADVVLLQETTHAWELLLRQRFARTYPHLHFQHDARYAGGFAVMSRAPLAQVEHLARAADWFAAQRIVLETGLGMLQVLHVHLRPVFDDGDPVKGFFTTPPIRRREIEAYWAAMASGPATIVAGDFNEEPEGGLALAFLTERGLRRVDTGGLPTWEYKGSWRGNDVHLRLRLDHVVIDERLVAVDATVLDAGASDHRPVLVTLERARS